MNSQTITLTQKPVVIKLAIPQEDLSFEEIHNRIKELAKILNKETTDDYEDTLSLVIKEWAYALIDEIESLDSIEKIEDIAHKFFAVLYEKITDPLTGQIFREPLIEGDWVWEKKLYDIVKQDGLLSAYTAEFLSEAEPHIFLQDIIEWMHKLPKGTFPEEVIEIGYDINTRQGDCVYMAIGQQTAFARFMIEETSQMKFKHNFILKKLTELRAHLKEELLREKSSLEEHERTLENTLKGLTEDYDELVETLQVQIRDSKDKILDLRNKVSLLNKRITMLETENAKGRAHIQQLQVKLDSMGSSGGGGRCLVM